MADVARLMIEVDSRGVTRTRNELGRFVKGAGKAETATGSLTRTLGRLAVAFGGVMIVRKAIRGTIDFEKSMAEVASISTEVAGNLDNVSKQVRQVARTMGVDARGTAKALYQTISAGITDTARAMEVLRASTRAATAGLTETTVAVDVITSAMNAYASAGLSATEISDVLFTAVREGKTTFAELSSSMGRAMAIGAQAGVSFEDLTAAIVTLTKGGISTDEAVTSVRATIVSLLKPADDAAKFAGELGIQFNAAALKGGGLGKVLQDVRKATGGSAEAVARLFPNVRALGGVLALTGEQAGEFTRQLDVMSDTAGATAKAYAIMADTTSHKLDKMKAAFTDMGISLGNLAAGPLTSFAEDVTTVSDALHENTKEVDRSTIGIAQRIMAHAKNMEDFTAGLRIYNAAVGEVSGSEARRAGLLRDQMGVLRSNAEAEKRNAEAVKESAEAAKAAEIAEKALQEIRKRRHDDITLALKDQEQQEEAASNLILALELERMMIGKTTAEIAGMTAASKGATMEQAERIMALTAETEKLRELSGEQEKVTTTVKQLTQAQQMAASGVRSFSDAIVDWASGAEVSFSNVARDFAKMVAKMLLQQALLKAFRIPTGGAALGAAVNQGRVLPMARGGVVTQPTLFPMARGAGLMGEAGPEAVMPLTRTSRGELGVKTEGALPAVNVNIINNTGARVTESRRRRGDSVDIDVMIGDAISNHLNRGTADRAMRDSFGVRRRAAAR